MENRIFSRKSRQNGGPTHIAEIVAEVLARYPAASSQAKPLGRGRTRLAAKEEMFRQTDFLADFFTDSFTDSITEDSSCSCSRAEWANVS
jgi:hypothetical protein